MMWPFSRKVRPESGEIKAARAAEKRAEATIQQVDDRTDEVDLYYVNLSNRRRQNNFGAALTLAMERR